LPLRRKLQKRTVRFVFARNSLRQRCHCAQAAKNAPCDLFCQKQFEAALPLRPSSENAQDATKRKLREAAAIARSRKSQENACGSSASEVTRSCSAPNCLFRDFLRANKRIRLCAIYVKPGPVRQKYGACKPATAKCLKVFTSWQEGSGGCAALPLAIGTCNFFAGRELVAFYKCNLTSREWLR
jgi:hypothetical protein